MEKEDISNLDAYFQNENSNSDWIEKLFEEEKNEPELKQILNYKWTEILNSSISKVDLTHILYKIHYNINSKVKLQHISKTRQLYNQFSRIAAIFILPLLAVSIYLMVNLYSEPTQFSEIVAPKGEKAQFILPDGSSGYLNSGSTLRYASSFHKNRLVELKGEGFFDIVHDKKAFIVQAQKVKIKVHGTRFNVCAYDEDPDVITTLEEGSVSVFSDVDGNGMKIHPGEQAVFNKSSNQFKKDKVDIGLFVTWKENMLKFQNTPFADVVKKMERWYDVKIILDDNLKYSQHYTMTIKTESLREMLDLMIVTTPMKYEIKEDIVYIKFRK